MICCWCLFVGARDRHASVVLQGCACHSPLAPGVAHLILTVVHSRRPQAGLVAHGEGYRREPGVGLATVLRWNPKPRACLILRLLLSFAVPVTTVQQWEQPESHGRKWRGGRKAVCTSVHPAGPVLNCSDAAHAFIRTKYQ